MMTSLSRRTFLFSPSALALTACSGIQTRTINLDSQFQSLEKHYNARIGVWVLDTGANREIKYRADEKFPYCSTFKTLAVAALLKTKSPDFLNQRVTFTKEAVEASGYYPITEKYVSTGMTYKEACEATIIHSDNYAGNIVLETIGGPAGFNEFFISIGDYISHAARNEPSLNTAVPGDVRDTTTPEQFGKDYQEVVLGNALSPTARELLNSWLKANRTSQDPVLSRIRSGVPADWTIGDKTGAGKYGTGNNVAIAWPPGKQPIIFSIYSTMNDEASKPNPQLITDITKAVVTGLQKSGA